MTAVPAGGKVVMAIEEDFLLSSYDYDLPPGQIAQFPPAERGASRLMVLRRGDDSPPRDAMFANLPELLPEGSLLVVNNSRVVPARLKGSRPSGGAAEFLLLTPVSLIRPEEPDAAVSEALVTGLLKPAARIRIRDVLTFGAGISVQILEKGEFGQCSARLRWSGELLESLRRAGSLPLPPYIRRDVDCRDEDRYQTVYASSAGSVAAPTAGLHFTEAMRQRLVAAGHEWVELSLHVGYGTFSPVRCSDIRGHAMHSEYVDLPAEAAAAVLRAKAEKRPVIAVGTTALRALEGIAGQGPEFGACSGFVNLFVYPGFEFRIVDGLLTNFHLPCSTLLMLVAALAGRRRVLSAYGHAVRAGYRFFSYGDAMLLA